jgi:hypothetical protein
MDALVGTQLKGFLSASRSRKGSQSMPQDGFGEDACDGIEPFVRIRESGGIVTNQSPSS